MLVRAARRPRRPLRNAPTAPLPNSLPPTWLCPALSRWRQHTTSGVPVVTGPRNEQPRTTSPSRKNTRHMATATSSSVTPPEPLPFNAPWLANPSFMPHDWNPRSPHIVPPLPPLTKLNYRRGIGGTWLDLMQNLNASIKVGRLDRAALVVERIMECTSSDSTECITAHNVYLDGLFRSIASGNPDYSYTDMRKWYTSQIRSRGVKADATTLSTLIKAAVAHLEPQKRDQHLSEYIEHAKQARVFEETMDFDYSVEEFMVLERLSPEAFQEEPTVNESTAIESLAEFLPESSLQSLPEVKQTKQKGYGLATLRKTLQGLNEIADSPNTHEPTQDEMYSRQLALEETVVEQAIDRWRKEQEGLEKLGVKSVTSSRSMDALMAKWFLKLKEVLQVEMKEVKAGLARPKETNDPDRLVYGPYMELFSVEKLAAVTILSVVQAFGVPDKKEKAEDSRQQQLVWLTMNLTKNLINEYNATAPKATEETQRNRGNLQNLPANKRSKYARLMKKQAEKIADTTTAVTGHSAMPVDLPLVTRAKLGALLIEKLFEAATVDVHAKDPRTGAIITRTHPAFSHTTVFFLGKKVGRVNIHHALAKKMTKEPMQAHFIGLLPMLVEPRSWSGIRKGGYLQYPTDVIRFGASGDDVQLAYAKSAADKGDLDMIFAGLNILGKTPWRVNRNVLNVMIEAWNKGEHIAGLAPENPDMPLPPDPGSGDFAARRAWLKEVKIIENQKSGYHSQRSFQNLQLEIARAFRDSTLYFPHNIDFRGRAYPVPPLLNHMGADPARGLMAFAQGKELGEIGLRWLKVHLANVAGHDKASLSEREKFTMDHLEDIRDSVTRPLDGKQWWLKSEDPWQTLATCFELVAALDSPDPTKFVSHLPVHQDGTCNGLQHYAALGGDAAGAAQVNLVPGDRPADIYTAVADLVKSEIRRRANEGNEMARLVQDKITRKVVKQTVMTNVYGVTFYGAIQQVKKQLKDIFPTWTSTEETLKLTLMATEVATAIFGALGTLFTGAQKIQYWLAECASRVSSSLSPEQLDELVAESEGQLKQSSRKREAKNLQAAFSSKKGLTQTTLIWTTPLKLPVVQPYRDQNKINVTTALQTLKLRVTSSGVDPVNKRKQVAGFPPNFIHSLDATHMMLSALKSHEEGLTFAAVHDSFWTHAGDIPTMNTILRDAFVRMHSDDVVGRLAEELKARYGGHMRLASISPDSEIGSKILKARQGKSKKAAAYEPSFAEVVTERKRQKLLESSDPAEQEQGRQMITPTSIFEACTAAGQHVTPEAAPEVAVLGSKSSDGVDSIEAADTTELEDGFVADGSAIGVEGDVMAILADDPATEEVSPKAKSAPRKAAQKMVKVWVPMDLPPIPQKGDFDVGRLKQSQYFFS